MPAFGAKRTWRLQREMPVYDRDDETISSSWERGCKVKVVWWLVLDFTGALPWPLRLDPSHREIGWSFPQGIWRAVCANVSTRRQRKSR
jgi:hypothetical protein